MSQGINEEEGFLSLYRGRGEEVARPAAFMGCLMVALEIIPIPLRNNSVVLSYYFNDPKYIAKRCIPLSVPPYGFRNA
jgi:hypothetical protein